MRSSTSPRPPHLEGPAVLPAACPRGAGLSTRSCSRTIRGRLGRQLLGRCGKLLFPCPGGTSGNGPPFQPCDPARTSTHLHLGPGGTTENLAIGWQSVPLWNDEY